MEQIRHTALTRHMSKAVTPRVNISCGENREGQHRLPFVVYLFSVVENLPLLLVQFNVVPFWLP